MRVLNRSIALWRKHGDAVKQQVGLTTTGIIILFAIISIACSVRFWDLGQIGFNNDEAIYSGQADNISWIRRIFGRFFDLSCSSSSSAILYINRIWHCWYSRFSSKTSPSNLWSYDSRCYFLYRKNALWV